MSSFLLQINTPVTCMFDAEVDAVGLTTSSGVQSYLANHWDSVVQLEVGIVEIENLDNTKTKIAVNGGVATFQQNKLVISTVEAEQITGRKPDLNAFPATLKLKNQEVQNNIQIAMQEAGIFDENKQYISALLSEERIAKVQILNEIIKGI